MAIKNFKTILDNKAYMINPSDRKIFENGELASFFGLSSADNIEFIVYDANDNQLPQGDYGLVRYIPMTTDTINDYILIPEGTVMTQNNFPTEYFVDVERLLNDAGYTNGIFKTQITLINKRVGSENTDDKLWIKEISPTRTEVRLLPLNAAGTPIELQQRFGIFTGDGNFSEDILPNIPTFLDKITPNGIDEYISTTYTPQFLSRLLAEYQIPNMDAFATTVHAQFIKEAKNTFNKVQPVSELSVDDVKSNCVDIIRNTLLTYLPTISVESTVATMFTAESMNALQTVDQSKTSNITYGVIGDVIENTLINKPVESAAELLLKYKLKGGVVTDTTGTGRTATTTTGTSGTRTTTTGTSGNGRTATTTTGTSGTRTTTTGTSGTRTTTTTTPISEEIGILLDKYNKNKFLK